MPPPSDISFRLLYEEHFDFVWRCARTLRVSDSDLPDVTQEVFLVVHQRLHEWQGGAKFITWLYKITHYVSLNHRKKGWRHWRPVQALLGLGRSDDHSPLTRVEATLDLQRLIARLSEEQREVVILTEIGGLSAREIAEATGEKPNTVSSRLRLARLKLDALARGVTGCKDKGLRGPRPAGEMP